MKVYVDSLEIEVTKIGRYIKHNLKKIISSDYGGLSNLYHKGLEYTPNRCKICNSIIEVKYDLEKKSENHFIITSNNINNHLCNKKGCKSFNLNKQSFEFVMLNNDWDEKSTKQYFLNKGKHISEARTIKSDQVKDKKAKELNIFNERIRKILERRDIVRAISLFSAISNLSIKKLLIHINKYSLYKDKLSVSRHFHKYTRKCVTCNKMFTTTDINFKKHLNCSKECYIISIKKRLTGRLALWNKNPKKIKKAVDTYKNTKKKTLTS